MAARRPNPARGPRRKTLWLQFQPTNVTLGSGSSALIFSLNAAALALRPFTLVRSHFEIMTRSDQSAAVEQQLVGVGMAVVSDESRAVGITAIPTPISELGSSLWFLNRLIFGQESTVIDTSMGARTVAVDSKAMRKVEVGQDIVIVGEASATGEAAILTLGGRILVKTN